MTQLVAQPQSDPYLQRNPEPVDADYGSLVAFIANTANTALHENPGAVAFNATKYFAAGLYGSPLIDEQAFEAIYVSQRPDLKGKWKPGMRYLQADYLLGDSERVEQMGSLTGDYTWSAIGGSLVGGVVDPVNVAFMGAGGVGGIAKGTGALARTGRMVQKAGRFLAPDAARGAGVGARMAAGARQGGVEFTLTEPATFVVQDRYLQQERDAVDLLVSGTASVLLPVGAHALSKRVGPDPLTKRDKALKVPIIQNELDPASVDAEARKAMDALPARRAEPGIDYPMRDADKYVTEVRQVFQSARDRFQALSASSADPAVIREVADTVKRIDAEIVRFDREGLIGPGPLERGKITRSAESILEELRKYHPKTKAEKPEGVLSPLSADEVDSYVRRLESFVAEIKAWTPDEKGNLNLEAIAKVRNDQLDLAQQQAIGFEAEGYFGSRVLQDLREKGKATVVEDATKQQPPRSMTPVQPDRAAELSRRRAFELEGARAELESLSRDWRSALQDKFTAVRTIRDDAGRIVRQEALRKDEITRLGNMISALEKWSGRKIRFYTDAAAKRFGSLEGAASLHTPDTIYINPTRLDETGIYQTIGHELYHTLIYQNPKMAEAIERALWKSQAFRDSIQSSISQWGINAWEAIPANRKIEELVANAVGQMFTSPEFFSRMAAELGQSGFQRLLSYIMERLQDLRRVLRGEGFESTLVRDLFHPINKAMQSTKEGRAFFQTRDQLLAYRSQFTDTQMPVWRKHINDAWAEENAIDDLMDKMIEDFQEVQADEAGDTSVTRGWHNNTEFRSTGMRVVLTNDDLVRLDSARDKQLTLANILREKSGNGNSVLNYIRKVRRAALDMEEDGISSSPLFAWRKVETGRAAQTYELLLSKAPKSGVSKSQLPEFSRALARTTEILSEFTLWSRDYEGRTINYTGEDFNNLTAMAEALQALANGMVFRLSGAQPLTLDPGPFKFRNKLVSGKRIEDLRRPKTREDWRALPEDEAMFWRRYMANEAMLDGNFMRAIKHDPDYTLFTDFVNSREYSNLFIELEQGHTVSKADAGKPSAGAPEPQAEANRYYTAFMEALQAYSNRKRAELQGDMDPDVVASFDAWQDRVKEFHSESSRFTATNTVWLETKAEAKAKAAQTTEQEIIEEALKDWHARLKKFQGSETKEGLVAGGSATDAHNELRNGMAAKLGMSPKDMKFATLIDTRHDLASKLPDTIIKHYVETGIADEVIRVNPSYTNRNLEIAAIRGLWDDLVNQDVNNPNSLFAQRKRSLEDMLEEANEDLPAHGVIIEDRLSKLQGSLEDNYAKTNVTADGVTMPALWHDALHTIARVVGEAKALQFMLWKRTDIIDNLDEASQVALANRMRDYQAQKKDSFLRPKMETLQPGQDLAINPVTGTYITADDLNEALEAGASRPGDFSAANDMDQMPSVPAQAKADEMKDFTKAMAFEITQAQVKLQAPMLKHIEGYVAANPGDADLRTAYVNVQLETQRAKTLRSFVRDLLDPTSSDPKRAPELDRTIIKLQQGRPLSHDSRVQELLERAFRRSSDPATFVQYATEELEIMANRGVDAAIRDAYAKATMRTKGQTLAHFKTWMDGVARITKGFFAGKDFENVTTQEHGSLDAALKEARSNAGSEVASLIQQLPWEIRANAKAGAEFFKSMLKADTDPNAPQLVKDIRESFFAGVEYARGRLNRAGAMIASLDGFFMSHRHSVGKIGADLSGWKDFMLRKTDWERVSERIGNEKLATDAKVQEGYLDAMYNDLRNGQVEADRMPFDVHDDNLAKRDRFHRTHEFLSDDDAIDYDMAYGSGDTMNEALNQVMRRAERAVLMENFGPNYAQNVKEHLAWLKDQEPKPKGRIAQQLQDWSYTRARHTFEHQSGILNNPVNERVAAFGQTVRMFSSAAFGWMTTPSSVTDLANMKAVFRSMGARKHGAFVRGLSAFANNWADLPAEYRTAIEASAGAYQTLLSAAMRGDTEYAGKGLSRRGNDFIYTMNLQRRWVRTQQFGFTDVFVRHLADMADEAKTSGKFNDEFANYAKFYGLTPDELAAAAQFTRTTTVSMDGTTARVLMPAEIGDAKLRSKIQRMMIDTMDHAVLQPSASDTAFLTFGTRAGTVTGELVRTMMQFKGFSLAMNVRMRRRYRAYGMGDLEFNRMNLDRLYHAAGLTAMGLLATQLKDVMNGKEPLHFMDEDQRTAENVHRVLMQAGLFTVLSDLGIDSNRPGQALMGPAVGQMFRFGTQLMSDEPNGGLRALGTAMQATPGATLPIWNPLKHELFGQMVYEAYGLHRDALTARLQTLTGQTQVIDF